MLAVGLAAAPPPSPAEPAPLPPACLAACEAPYGERLGASPDGVPAYSNCNAGCVSRQEHVADGVFLGVKWQCVEFARRWLMVNRGVAFGEVDAAADVWTEVTALRRLTDGAPVPVTAHPNGAATPPAPGDLLVYGRGHLGTGHLAVVTEVDLAGGQVAVAEQNLENRRWQGDHARRIDLVHHDGRYCLRDPHLLGWKHPEGIAP